LAAGTPPHPVREVIALSSAPSWTNGDRRKRRGEERTRRGEKGRGGKRGSGGVKTEKEGKVERKGGEGGKGKGRV